MKYASEFAIAFLVVLCALPAVAQKCHDNIVITIERSACFGTCPVYSAKIYADGSVVYVGKEFVKEVGERRFKIAQDTLQQLIKEFEKIDYFSLKDKYHAEVTDLPTTTTSICLNGKKKKVVNYFGAPQKLHELENKIDELAGLKLLVGR